MTTAAALPKRSRTRPRSGIDDLDDGCVLKIFSYLSPLPDLFHMSCSCKRFRDLTSDGRLWFSVGSGPARPMQPPGMRLGSHVVGRGKHVSFANLKEAVGASRPGDTIVLEAGQDHVAADVIISWPLHLVGASARPEDTRIVCPRGATSALDFRASGKVVNLTIQVEMGSCILHQKGRLAVEGCILTCKAGGLAHLFHPLVTSAVGAAPTGCPTPAFPTAAPAASPSAAVTAGLQHDITPTCAVPSSSDGHPQLSLPASAAATASNASPLGSARVGVSQSSGSMGPSRRLSNASPMPPQTPPLQTNSPCPTSAVDTPCSTAVRATHSAAAGAIPPQLLSPTLQASCSTQQPTHLGPLHSGPLHMQQDSQQHPPSAAFSNAGDSIRPSLPFAAMPPAPWSTLHPSQGPHLHLGQNSAVGAGWKRPGPDEAGSQPLVNNSGRLQRGVYPGLLPPAGIGFRGVGRLSVVETKIRGAQGARAVRCCGSGTLQGVRTIHLSRDTLFWFQVDSAVPGTQLQSPWGPAKPHKATLSPHQPPSSQHPGPSPQEPEAKDGGTGQEEKGEWGSLEEKAESWRTSRQHHSWQPQLNVNPQAEIRH